MLEMQRAFLQQMSPAIQMGNWELMFFSTQEFSFWGFYPSGTVHLEGAWLLRWSWREHCRNSHFLKMFWSPAIIWRRERSLCQHPQGSWPFVTQMHDMRVQVCFPEQLQVILMRDGKFRTPPAPKALHGKEDRVFDEYTKCLKSNSCAPRYWHRVPAHCGSQQWGTGKLWVDFLQRFGGEVI